VGNKASIKPPVHAQSAGDQNTAALPVGKCCDFEAEVLGATADFEVATSVEKPNQFWLHTNPVKLPIKARCGINAPLGGPVVPLV
jgi:hypothetical protein